MKTARSIISMLLAAMMLFAAPIAAFAEEGGEAEPAPAAVYEEVTGEETAAELPEEAAPGGPDAEADGGEDSEEPDPEAREEDAEGEPAGFPASDRDMIDNSTDSSKLPTYAELTDVYGQIDNENADIVDSLISDEARERFSAALDRIADFEPVEDGDVSLVLGGVEKFLARGGVGSYLTSGDLQAGAEIGLRENRLDKVKILGEGSNAGAWVFVVDKDAMSWFVRDSDGMGIANALVTVSYLDDSGQRVTASIVASEGRTPGIAVFDGLPDTFYGIVDIQAEGYRAVSVLDKRMGMGEHFSVVLEESKPDELYIRGVDLSGKDLVNEETKLSLVDMDTEDLALKVLVTKTGGAQFPESIDIRSDSRGSVLTVSQASAYAYDGNTRVYTASKRWAEKGAGLLRDGDRISVDLGSASFALEHVTVKDAVAKPGAGETSVPITTQQMPGNISDRMGGAGWLNMTAQVLQVPVTFGLFPDGSMILMASYDITKLDPNTQYKFSSLFQKSWNPKNAMEISDPLEVFEKSFWENTEKVKAGREILESANKIKHIANKNYDFSMSFSLFLRSCYNEQTDDTYGTGGILFSGGLTAGITEYFLFPVGPIVIPAYIGFEGHIKVNTTLSVNFCMDRAPTGHDQDAKWKYATDDGVDVNARIEFIAGFSVFGGVGVKGVLGAGATGFVDFDIATVLGKGKASVFTADPHSFIDVLYGLRVEYYLLFYSGVIKIDCASDEKRLWDSNGEKDLTAEPPGEIEFTPLSLADCAEDWTPQLAAPGEERDEAFLLSGGNGELEGSSQIVSVDYAAYPDSQIQFAATGDYTALFRIASDGKRTDIYYQLQSEDTGDVNSVIYRVALPEGETRSVSEFVAVPNKTDRDDPDFRNMVYIGAVLADGDAADENGRMRSTDVAAIVVDLDRRLTVSSVIASDPEMRGEYLYSAPRPAGREDYCSVAYAATWLRDDNGNEVDGLAQVLGLTPGYTTYCISWGEPDDPAARTVTNIGGSKVHSTGAIAPNEPSFWSADRIRSTDKYLVINGYGANGYYEDTLRCNVRVDIDGFIDPQDLYDGTVTFDSIITNWQYINGCSYFVAGDSVYWMNRVTKGSDPSDYEWSAEKVENGAGVISVDGRYAMITNGSQSAVYLIGVVGDYDVSVEDDVTDKGANIVKIYTITTDRNWAEGGLTTTLHGPLDLKFAKGETVDCFSAAYNSERCAAAGLTLAFSSPAEDGSRTASRIRLWKQNADKGLLVTGVKIPEYLVIEGQPFVELDVTVRNYGYGRENPVPYTVCDENGVKLVQVINGVDVWETFYTSTDMYTGDSRVDRLVVRPNPDWEVNAEHEIIVDLRDNYRYDGDIDDVVNSAAVRADNTTLTAENTLIGGKHHISMTVENHTVTGETPLSVKIVPDYGDGTGSPAELVFPLPMSEPVLRYDPDDEGLTGQVYHFDIDMDGVWADGLAQGMRGAYVSLMDGGGVRQSNETLYLLNPAEEDAPEAAPAFRSQSLSLSGRLGVNFFLELPAAEGTDYTQSWMEFTVGKAAEPQRADFDAARTNAKGYYGFTCLVSPVQMADTITAVFHYGDGLTAEKTYSVKQYILAVEANSGKFDEKTLALVRALADYGHYAQLYLSSVNGWTVGEKYAEMDLHFTEEYDYAKIRAELEGLRFDKGGIAGTKIAKASYRLVLDSSTAVEVFLTPEGGAAVTASASFGGKTLTASKQADGRYMVRIPDIVAHRLGDMATVSGTAGDGAFSVRVSALSYAYSVLKNNTDAESRNCMAALYAYYAAAKAYRGG